MRKPSRQMPPAPSNPMTWTGAFVLTLFGVGFVLLVCYIPVLLLLIGVIVVTCIALNFEENRRLKRMAADRPRESICSFARSFDCRAIDTWIIRAVFEELQPYCSFGRGHFPLRPTDDLHGDLRIDPEDLEGLAENIAYRAGRSLEDSDKNPYCGNVQTVSDLIMFFVNQPRCTA